MIGGIKMDNVHVSTEEKITEMQAQIVELKAELNHERLRKAAYDEGYKAGTQIVALIQGLCDSGVKEEHAISLLIAGMKAGVR